MRAEDGNSYPVGSLPVGTLINNLELYPDGGALVARAAGTTAQIIRKSEDKCIIKLPSKRLISVELHCVATVGRVSNEDHDKRVIGKAGRNRWLGIRPKSGLWKRKTGRFGRKIKPAKPVKAYGNTRKIKVERETRYLDIQRPYGHHQTLTTSGNYINNKEYYIPYGGQNLSRRLKWSDLIKLDTGYTIRCNQECIKYLISLLIAIDNCVASCVILLYEASP